MAEKYRKLTKYTGVYERISEKRIYNGKPDICFDIVYKAQGKLVWEKVGWLSEGYGLKAARDVRNERLRTMRHGEELPKQKKKAPFFKDVAERYLEWAKVNKTGSVAGDISRYHSQLKGRFDGKRLNEISSFDLERMKADLLKRGLSPGSVNQVLALFRQMVNKALAWGMYKGENPIKGVKMLTLQNQRERFLSHEEASLLLADLKKTSYQLHDMALLALHCGLRAGEIFNLKSQDLDFENGLINISDPKNKESRKAFMTNAIKNMLLARVTGNPAEFIFKDPRHGGKIQAISQAFRKVIDRLEFNKGITDPRQLVVFHTLRHTFASWLALQGETIIVIKELLGHKTLAMTQRYSHLTPDMKREAALALEASFNESQNSAERTGRNAESPEAEAL